MSEQFQAERQLPIAAEADAHLLALGLLYSAATDKSMHFAGPSEAENHAKQRLENHVRLTRDLQTSRSHHHATNAVYPPASLHGVFACTNRGPAARTDKN